MGLVAQLVEQDTHNVEVGGSYPSGSTVEFARGNGLMGSAL
jgi:hypothetical protein